MADFDEHGVALEAPEKPQPGGRLAGIGRRLAQAFTGIEYAGQRPDSPSAAETASWQSDMPRFAVVRHGYHCGSVDEYVAQLEQELGVLDQEIAQLRAQTSQTSQAPQAPPAPEAQAAQDVAAELKRVGEQTSAVLIAAHDQAHEVVREAEAEAERKLGAAKSEAETIVARAEQRLRDLEIEMQSVHSQRARLLEDLRSTAGSLTELADLSVQRFPPQPGSGESESDPQVTESHPLPA